MLGQHASLQVDLSLEWLPMQQNEILSKSEPLPKTSKFEKNKMFKMSLNKTEKMLALV